MRKVNFALADQESNGVMSLWPPDSILELDNNFRAPVMKEISKMLCNMKYSGKKMPW